MCHLSYHEYTAGHNIILLSETEIECLTNPAGNGYRGTVNVSASGRPCLPWTEVADLTLTSGLIDTSIAEAVNYCRVIAISNLDEPFCVTAIDDTRQTQEKCDIGYCGKQFMSLQINLTVGNTIGIARMTRHRPQTRKRSVTAEQGCYKAT